MTAELPIHAVLPDLLAALRERSSAVLVAPPGAGKTTAVAPALLDQPWCTGEVLLLSPRRLAARAAAERMAALAGEPVGKTFGYATRLDTKKSAETRVTVVTEGIFTARIQRDPFRGEITRDDVAAMILAVLTTPESAGHVLYVNAGDEPIELALAEALGD